jgi:hypothetical protein
VGKPLEKICPVWHHPGAAVDLLSCILSEPVVSNRSRNFVVIDRAGVAHPVQWRISPISNDSDVVIGAMVMLETALPGAEHGRLIEKNGAGMPLQRPAPVEKVEIRELRPNSES